jgi:hypothetical protein
MATFTLTPSGDVVLCLSDAEARGLGKLASEGASAILNDVETAATVLGNHASIEAARRGLDAIRRAAPAQCKRPEETPI